MLKFVLDAKFLIPHAKCLSSMSSQNQENVIASLLRLLLNVEQERNMREVEAAVRVGAVVGLRHSAVMQVSVVFTFFAGCEF